MRINDLPRPWLLAAVTGVPMSELLERAERERAERAEEAHSSELRAQYLRARSVRQRHREPVEPARLAS